jgi:hypothetical protein
VDWRSHPQAAQPTNTKKPRCLSDPAFRTAEIRAIVREVRIRTMQTKRTVRKPLQSSVSVTPRDRLILRALSEMKFLRTSQIARIGFGRLTSTVGLRLRRLLDVGFVKVWLTTLEDLDLAPISLGTDHVSSHRISAKTSRFICAGSGPALLYRRGGGPSYIPVSARAVRHRLSDLRRWTQERLRQNTAEGQIEQRNFRGTGM